MINPVNFAAKLSAASSTLHCEVQMLASSMFVLGVVACSLSLIPTRGGRTGHYRHRGDPCRKSTSPPAPHFPSKVDSGLYRPLPQLPPSECQQWAGGSLGKEGHWCPFGFQKGTFLNPPADIFPLSGELGVVSGPPPPKVPVYKEALYQN